MAIKDKKRGVLANKLGVKMVDVGERHSNKGLSSCMPESPSVYYPSLYLNTKQLPSLKGSDVSTKMKMILEGEIMSHSMNKNKHHDNESFDVQVKKIGIMNK